MQETHYAAALNPALESSHSPLPSLEPQKTTIATVNAVDSYDINGSAKDESHGESTLQDIFGDMTADSTTTPASTVSKRAQNKLKRKERELATREEYKAKLKAKRVAKKEAKRELRQQQPFETLPADEQARIEERRRRADPSLKDPSSMGVVVDLSFDELMHEKEINSTALQISRCYTANRNGMRPCQLVVSSFEGRVKTRMETSFPQWQKWKLCDFKGDNFMKLYDPCKLVYLTADSENVVEELDESRVYIVGGLVDRNRHKNICFKKATELGITNARLPIDRYIDMKTRSVLTINQVLEILVLQLETKDWEKTLLQVIPGRKGAKSASTASRGEDVVCGDDRDAESEGDDNQLESPQVLVQGVLVTSTASETVGREE